MSPHLVQHFTKLYVLMHLGKGCDVIFKLTWTRNLISLECFRTMSGEEVAKVSGQAKVPIVWRTPRKLLFCQNSAGQMVPVKAKSKKTYTVCVMAQKKTKSRKTKRIRVLKCIDMNSEFLNKIADLLDKNHVYVIKRKKRR